MGYRKLLCYVVIPIIVAISLILALSNVGMEIPYESWVYNPRYPIEYEDITHMPLTTLHRSTTLSYIEQVPSQLPLIIIIITIVAILVYRIIKLRKV